MACIELNWSYMHERVHDFIHGVIDDIKKMSPQDRAMFPIMYTCH